MFTINFATFNGLKKNANMKHTFIKLIAVLIFSFSGILLFGQEKIKSPRDSAVGTIGKANISVNYGSPSVKGRKIWGDLVPFGKVWRAGANEATVFATNQTLSFNGKNLPAGKYSFFIIPTENEWTIIFNKTAKQWGAYEYSEKNDALRVVVKPKKTSTLQEKLIYKINKNSLSLFWENMELMIPVESK